MRRGWARTTRRSRPFNFFGFLDRLGLDGVALYYELCFWWIGRGRTSRSLAILNFGYAPVSKEVAADPLCAEPLQAELYNQVGMAVGTDRLQGGRVLEVSCGSGGGFDLLRRQYGIGHGVVLDRSSRALRLARRLFGLEGVRADAMHLPFARDSFDVVLTVEASHMYAMARFASEAAAVLAPDGVLCVADYRRGTPVIVEALLARTLAEAGLKLIQFRDVTANIVESLGLDSGRREADIARVPWPLRRSFRQWSAVENTPQYERLTTQQETYFILVAQREPRG
jgi:SAM-dependent methyltransferase